MPKEHEDIEEMPDLDPVTSITDEADASEGAEQSADAKSSSAKDASKTEDDTLSVVRNVVDERGEASTEASSASEEETGGKPDDKEDTAKEPDNENYSDVPFNKHPRFQEVLGQLKTFRVDAERYKNVESFIDEQGLSGEEAADLLKVGGLIKTDPVKAWPLIKPIVQKVLLAAGEILPEDLKTKVQAGEMSHEAALEVSRNRALVQSADVRREFETKRATTREQTNARGEVLRTVNSWEADRRARDPNFDAKMPAIEKEVAWLQTKEGRPDTPEGVKAQLQKAYDAASAAYQPPAPRQEKRAITPVRGGQVSGNVRPEVKSTLDIVNAEIAKRRAS